MSANDIASQLSAVTQNGSSYMRLRMEIQGATKETLQLQIKQRRTRERAPKSSIRCFTRRSAKANPCCCGRSGIARPPDRCSCRRIPLRAIDDLKDPLLGSDLAYEDVVENFFAWDQQALGGTEEVDRVSCQILESKPGKGDKSIYGSVRSWIDLRRMVPLRVEKYSSSGQLVRRIDTTRVVSDAGHQIPANLTVRARAGSSTDLDGSRIKHDVAYTDRDFSTEGLNDITAPRGN